MLKNLKISAKLSLLALSFLVILVLLGLHGLSGNNKAHNQLNQGLKQLHLLTTVASAADATNVEFKTQVQEWKNILLRGSNPKDFEKYLKAFNTQQAAVVAGLNQTKTMMTQAGLPTLPIDKLLAEHNSLHTRYLEALKSYDVKKSGSAQAVDALVRGMDRQTTEALTQLVASIRAELDGNDKALNKALALQFNNSRLVSVLGFVLAFVVGSLLVYLVSRSITKPINKAVAFVERVSKGDLRGEIESYSQDEIGLMLQNLANMQANLRNLIVQIQDSADSINNGAREIAQGNTNLSHHTEAQASSLEETSSSMEQMASTVKQNADNASQANVMANEATQIAVKGEHAVSRLVVTMAAINASSKKIVDIISVIDGIAFQTNILALNAAVEAARAGEQGRGFAVVASEVRNLSQRSASAAKEIKQLIGDSVEKVAEGTLQAQNAGETMDDILMAVKLVTDSVNEIAAASLQQSAGIDQVNQAISSMDESMQHNAAQVEQAAAAAVALQERAQTLIEAASQFKLAQQKNSVAADAQPVNLQHITTAPVNALPKAKQSRLKAPKANNDDWTEF